MAFTTSYDKVTAPTKKSIFERQKQEAEAKKIRDKAETEAVYEDFVKSFEQDDTPTISNPGRTNTGGYGPGPGGKRHFTSTSLKSGPGSLGPGPLNARGGPGSLGPGFGRKRYLEEQQHQRNYGQSDSYRLEAYRDDTIANERANDQDEADVKSARPTLHLSSLPPGTSPGVIKALFTPSPLNVEDVRILPKSTADRKASSAIVTLAAETAATDIDTVVSALQNKYLGYGFNLSISRHLSSAALGSAGALGTTVGGLANLPFGARPIVQQNSLSRAPPPGQGRGFAPPSSYTSSTPYQRREQSQILVQPPSDLKQIRLIHKTIETLLKHGPEFEALLMSRPEVQREEQWSWIWDTKSLGGIYYRWRLWKILTGSQSSRGRPAHASKPEGDFLFEGQSVWVPAGDNLKFEYTTAVEEFITDDDYDSSDEEADFEEGGLSRRHNDHNASTTQDLTELNDGHGYLNPLAKAKLIHLLSRLPDINTKLRRGDVMRLTAFAIEHAGTGAREVASIITRNVTHPLSSRQTSEDGPTNDKDQQSTEPRDTSPASLVNLYIISDILQSSASAGVRHAWRYRQLFETALRQQNTFAKLGRLDRDLNWGKLKAEKWKRSIQNLLQLWEGWCVFPQTSHDEMVQTFLNPPLSKEEQRKADEEELRRVEDETSKRKAGNKWRSVADQEGDVQMSDAANIDGRAMSDDDDDNDEEDAPIDEAMLIDEAVDGVPIVDSSDEEMADDNIPPPPPPPPPDFAGSATTEPAPPSSEQLSSPAQKEKAAPVSRGRQRPRATDMFADDSDDG